MSAKDLIIQEMQQVPEALLEEVLDFLRFIKAKEMQEKLEIPSTAITRSPPLKGSWSFRGGSRSHYLR